MGQFVNYLILVSSQKQITDQIIITKQSTESVSNLAR